MKPDPKRIAVAAVALSCTGIAMGCGTLGGILAMEPEANMEVFETSRARVVAELREAKRLGLTEFGEGDAPVATAEQNQRIWLAGERAAALEASATEAE